MKKKQSGWWIALAIVLVLMMCSCGCLVVALLAVSYAPHMRSAGDAVAIVEVKGTIMSGEAPGGFGETGIAYSGKVIADLKKAEDDPSVAAIVLDVDSPGGGVTASADIHRALTECYKPIVTSMGDVAASGGYYIACGPGYGMARPSTITASISVISQYTNAQELLKKLGIEIQTIKTGKYKDQGSLARPLTEEEIAMQQEMLDEAYDEFVRVIVEGREMSEKEVRAVAEGRVVSGRQALELGLVDELGNLDDAIAVAAEAGGIEGEPRIVRYEQPVPSFLEILMGSLSRAQQPRELILLEELLGMGQTPKLQYLYTGR